MIPCKPIGHKLVIFFLSLFVFSVVNVSAQDGQALFMSKCASCHAATMVGDLTGPPLAHVEERWDDKKKLYDWIRDNGTLIKSGYPKAVELSKLRPSDMQIFEGITDAEITAILAFIDKRTKESESGAVAGGGTVDTAEGKNGNQGAIIFGVISLILAIIALILMQVNSNLKKMSDDSEGIERPEPVPFYRNKVYIAMLALIFFAIAGYFLTQAGIGFGRQKDYQPKQPIYYSHKVHAGVNQISCLYCHGNAWESKQAAIPSVNVCMNCHKSIKEYKGAPLYDEEGSEINGTAEIAKLYKFAGFDPKNPDKWDPSKAKPIQWERIHNLPDHVYFNHSQHVRAGKVQCQTCHGEITAMDEVKQFSELSMGWCVNCHRETKVDFNYSDSTGNKFYSLYEKFHNDLKPDTLKDASGKYITDVNGNYKIRHPKMDSVTVKDIGGLECQKCHY